MIRQSDFKKLIVVFKQAINEIADKDTYAERKAVLMDWINLMELVDKSLGAIVQETSKEVRLKMVKEFEEGLKDFDFLDDV